MELGRSGVGVGRVYMRYFGAYASLITLFRMLSSPRARWMPNASLRCAGGALKPP